MTGLNRFHNVKHLHIRRRDIKRMSLTGPRGEKPACIFRTPVIKIGSVVTTNGV